MTIHSTPRVRGNAVGPRDPRPSVESSTSKERGTRTLAYIRLGLLGAVIVASLTGWWKPLMSRDWVAFAATLVGGWPIFAEAWENLRKRRMTMELSMTIALAAALGIGQFLTALVIAFFVLVAEELERLTVSGGRRAIRELIDSLPRQVTVRRDGRETELNTEELRIGETIVIRPGQRLPADGEVTAGNSFVDQASVTGESLPVEKLPGSRVFAGTLNKDGVLEVRVESVGADTTFGKIIEIVEQAERSKAPAQRLADRLAAWLIYAAFGAAVLTFIVTRNLSSTIAAIIVAGACGVAAGTPLAVLAGIGSAARRGIVVKGGLYLEYLSRIDTIVLDKTGTLTLGVPEVVSVSTFNGAGEEEVLRIAATCERHSEHPLGEAIVRHARSRGLTFREYSDLRYSPGKGLACKDNGSEILVGSRSMMKEASVDLGQSTASESEGATSVFVSRNGRLLGAVLLADRLRREAEQTVQQLKRLGYRVILLTGDSGSTARVAGEALHVDEAIGDMLPHQKLEKIRQLTQEGHRVAMVGDGINDAPALAQATVGIAMGQGTDVALETAHVTLMTNDLSRLVELLAISRRCYRVIVFNFWGTVLVDAVGMALAVVGLLSPIVAALIHVGSELAFILNSARLFHRRSRPSSDAIA